MPSATLTVSTTIGGIGITGKVIRSGETPLATEVTIPAAKTGTLTTRTDNDTGIITAQAGHGLITGDHVDIYWSGGSRFSMAATVSGNAVTLDAGDGDNLPIATTAVTLSKRVAIDQGLDGAALKVLLVSMTRKGSVRFQDASVTVLAANLDAGEAYNWASGVGIANPLAATTVVQIFASNQSSVGTNVIQIGALLDTVPSLS